MKKIIELFNALKEQDYIKAQACVSEVSKDSNEFYSEHKDNIHLAAGVGLGGAALYHSKVFRGALILGGLYFGYLYYSPKMGDLGRSDDPKDNKPKPPKF